MNIPEVLDFENMTLLPPLDGNHVRAKPVFIDLVIRESALLVIS